MTLETGGDGQDAFLEGRVVSNYFISRTEVVFRSADGAVVYENAAQGFGIDSSLAQNASPRVMEMKSVVSSGMLTRNLKKGETYSVTVTARLSHGETLTVYTGEYTRN